MVAANGDAGAMLARVQVFAVGLVLVYLALSTFQGVSKSLAPVAMRLNLLPAQVRRMHEEGLDGACCPGPHKLDPRDVRLARCRKVHQRRQSGVADTASPIHTHHYHHVSHIVQVVHHSKSATWC